MTALTLVPGDVPLEMWRSVYFGAAVSLDASARPAVEAAAQTIATIIRKGEPVYGINTGFGKLASIRIAEGDLAVLQRNIVLSHCAGVGEPLAAEVVRLILALKLASLAQGASGVSWATLETLGACLDRGLVPVIPGQGSVGASGDLAPLAHMTAVLMGVGEAIWDGQRVPARAALDAAGIAPLVLGPKEGLALLNGTQVSTALALCGLFETERVFQAALVTGALSVDAAKGSDAPFDPRIQQLRRQPGQIAVAEALRRLIAGSQDPRLASPQRCARAGPLLPALPAAGHGRLPRSAAAGRHDPLARGQRRLRQPPGLLGHRRGAVRRQFPRRAGGLRGRHHRPGDLRDRLDRRAAHHHADRSGAVGPAAFLTPKPGLNSGFMIAQVTAAALVSENKSRAYPASVDSIPTSATRKTMSPWRPMRRAG